MTKPNLSLSHWLAIVAYAVGMMGAFYLYWQEGKTRVNVYAPKYELPAYHQIQSTDLTSKPYASRSVPSGTLKTPQEIVGRYTLTPLPKDEPLTANQLSVKVTPTRLTNTVAVSLPATPAMTFGGNLKAGDIVSITFAAPATQNGASPSPITFSDILVLDVKAVSQANTSPASIIVLAIPKTSLEEFATHIASSTTLISF